MRQSLYLALLGCLPLLMACNQGSTSNVETAAKQSTGGVAVIDLDEVARLLGRESIIKQSITAHETSLNQQLETMRVSYANQLNQRKQELAAGTDESQVAQVQALEQKAVAQIQQARQQAQNELNEQKRSLINSFREEVKPIASQVAATKGLSLVVSKNDTFLFAFDSAVDITKDVVARMQAHQPAATPAAPISGNSESASPAGTSLTSPAEPGLLPQAPERPLRR